jgi:DNA repair exonuclease SbcCD ATPase subunit
MEGMFNKLLDRDNPEKKLKKEIESTQFKKQSLVAAVQSELQEALQKRESLFAQIGKVEYANRKQGVSKEVHSEHFAQIDALNTQIEEKTAKIKEIEGRYDEEIRMLEKMLQQPAAPTVAAIGVGQAPCPNCGAGYVPGDDTFCASCGQRLPTAIVAQVAAEQTVAISQAAVASQIAATPASIGQDQTEILATDPNAKPPSFCGNCGKKYIAGEDLFCIECGQKLEG